VKVCLVVERLDPAAGGVETVAWNLARGLDARGVRVTVACREATAHAPPSIEVLRLGVPGFWQPLRVAAFSRAAARATRSGFDVVHSLARTRWQDVYRAGGGSHAAYMESVYRAPRLRGLLSPRHRLLLSIEEAVFRDPRQLIQCNSRGSATEIARRFRVPDARMRVVYNGVDTLRFHPEKRRAARAEMRRALRLDGPVALFVGLGFRRKGLDRAIEGLALGGPKDATLLVAGGGDPRAYRALAARLGVEPRVRFLGPWPDVERLHAAADLFVLPTRYDPFSNACLEAMASGLAVATTRSNGAAELIDPGVSGLVLEEGAREAFELLGEAQRLERMGSAARAAAEKRTWEAHAEEILQMYARLRR
jgi:UDP-glucose:(heptosyl)LPS alpha-1,3-glucosyltransferase